MMSVKVDATNVLAMLQKLQEKASNMTPVLSYIGERIRSSVLQNFEVGGRWSGTVGDWHGGGKKWAPLSQGRKAFKQSVGNDSKTLQFNGNLRNSISPVITDNQVEIGTNVAYAAIHQFGATKGPFQIKPKNKKALFWPGARHPVAIVNHPGFTIPARPFLVVQDTDIAAITAKIASYLSITATP